MPAPRFISFAAFLVAALVTLAALGAMGSAVTWGITVLLEGFTVAAVWVVALGWGRIGEALLVRTGGELFAESMAPEAARFALRAGVGFAVVMTLVHLLGLAGIVSGIAYAVIGVIGLAGLLYKTSGRALATPILAVLDSPVTSLAAVPAAMLLVASSFPPGILWPGEGRGYDALEYHLQIPREWLAMGAIRELPHNVYAYLPLNLEMLSLPLMKLRGGAHEAALAVQWLHASFALAVAGLLAAWVHGRTRSTAAASIAALAWLLLPWNLVTGSLAYNEQAAAFLGLAAWVLIWEGGLTRRGVACAAGICAGAAAGVKLTVAGLIVVPVIAAFIAFRDHEDLPAARSSKRLGIAVGLLCACAALMHAPYLARNAAWTGNPVFPFMTRAMGKGPWSVAEEWRWIDAHRPKGGAGERLAKLGNSGFADRQFGVGWWLVVAAGLVAAASRKVTRPLALGAATAVGVSMLFWLCSTHHQARFLQPLALPLAVAAGLGAAAIPGKYALPAVAVLGLAQASWLLVFFRSAAEKQAPPPAVQALGEPDLFARMLESPVFEGKKVLLVAEAKAFSFPAGTVYAVPFVTSPFARAWQAAQGDPSRVVDALRQSGIGLIIVNWDEAARLRSTYGLDEEISRENFARLQSAGLKRRADSPEGIDFFEVPGR